MREAVRITDRYSTRGPLAGIGDDTRNRRPKGRMTKIDSCLAIRSYIVVRVDTSMRRRPLLSHGPKAAGVVRMDIPDRWQHALPDVFPRQISISDQTGGASAPTPTLRNNAACGPNPEKALN